MKKEKSNLPRVTSLQQNAEAKTKKNYAAKTAKLTEAETLKLVHELELHQIELEMQIKELQLAADKTETTSALYDFASTGCFTLNQEGIIAGLNLSGAKLLRKDCSSLINCNFKQFVNEETREDFNNFLKKIFNDGSKVICEINLNIQEKPIIFLHLEGILSKDKQKCLLTTVDITDLKLSEKALREREDLFFNLFENAPVGYQSLDENGRLVLVNKAWLGIFGYTREQVIGRWFGDFLSPSFVDAFRERFPLFKSLGNIHSEFEMLDKNGEPHFIAFEGRIGLTPAGKFKQTHCILQDISKRKEWEAKTIESERLYHAMFEKNQAIKLLIDPEDGTIIDANHAASQFYGYSIAQLKSLKIKDINRLTPEQIQLEMADAVSEKRSYFNFRHRLASGELRDVEVYSSPIEMGGRILLHSIIHDITARKNAEEALRKNEELFRNMVEKMPTGVYKSTHEGKFIEVNPAFVKMLGYRSKEELMEIDIKTGLYFDIIDREPSPSYDKPTGPDVYQLRKKDGTAIWVEDHGWYTVDNEGEILFHEGILQDITKRVQAEQAQKQAVEILRLSEQRYRVFINSTKDMAFLKDDQLKYLLVNEANATFFGKHETEIIGKSDFDLMSYHGAEKCKATDLKALDSETLIVDEEQIEDRIYETHKFKVPLDNGKFGVGGYIRDITERKTAELMLAQQAEELIALNDTKDKFFSIIAHDLKSPFNSILGFSEMLKEEARYTDISTIENYASIINSTARNTFQLLENLLAWANSQRGLVPFKPVPVNIDQIIKNEFAELENIAKQKNIHLFSGPPSNKIIVADPDMLSTILRNLISNAIKFTPKNGKVQAMADIEDRAAIISISDTGVGMEPESIGKLFNLKSSFTTRGTENEKGTGLGLLLCKEFIEKHNGKIWVESVPGRGSRFSFSIEWNDKE